jgi:hypothetical protein
MECHRCEHRAAIEAGKFRGVAFEKTPCGRCSLVETSVWTRTVDEGFLAAATLVEDIPFDERGDGDGAVLPVAVLEETVALLMTLDPGVRDVVCWRYQGIRYGEIAKRLGVTTAAVEKRHRAALRQWPVLKMLFLEKVAKNARRKNRCGMAGRREDNKGKASEGRAFRRAI